MSSITAETRLIAVIGSPVEHSLSPALHNAAFEASGRNWRCVAFEVTSGGAGPALSAMETLGIVGYAVTMPHKADMAAAVDVLDPAASALGSVNTVVRSEDGSTLGASTDGVGLIDALVAADADPHGRRVAVVGAGGAGRSIIDALGRHGAAEIAVINRTADAGDRAARLAPQASTASVEAIASAEIVINATSVGMGSEVEDLAAVPFDPRLVGRGQVVVDIVYHPIVTPLLSQAADQGARTIDGLEMLVYQAIRQHEIWTGDRIDPDVMRRAALAELATRQDRSGR
ncbi:MAG: shikimate dehydrogenase [Ilumatobacter coccineus]|uniref:Shikimate dehydrogenase (NADP(+)) n=1 Tax=Ilumatobacter coccineus TaxID=467094 RepID=A0A2G6KGN3_9ACTN|nr:MAG: shikimate dehydrogenase [Ilumatobacter coccineus]